GPVSLVTFMGAGAGAFWAWIGERATMKKQIAAPDQDSALGAWDIGGVVVESQRPGSVPICHSPYLLCHLRSSVFERTC
ncbi:MAG: hypothetical protein EBT95_10635, partial [Verrucomicrobia bacterium]|nr:hypothetical protein [Verrucomicrobiota bacterium]